MVVERASSGSTSSRKKKRSSKKHQTEEQQATTVTAGAPVSAGADAAGGTPTRRRSSRRRSSTLRNNNKYSADGGAMISDALLYTAGMVDDEEQQQTRPRTRVPNGVVAGRATHPSSSRRFSYRAMLLWLGLSLLVASLIYFTLAPAHSNSCWITRSPRGVRAEQRRAESDLVDEVGVEPPAVEAVVASPEKGRGRSPRWFYRNQTLIMIGLLLACLALKLIHAWLYIRVRRDRRPSRTVGGPGETDALVANGVAPLRADPPASAVFFFEWWEAYRILYSYLWYLAAYFLCNALKSILADFSCSDHGNSVSGHYLFFTFAMWTLAYQHLAQKRLVNESMLSHRFWRRLLWSRSLRPLEYCFLLVYTCFCWVCVSILADTYLFGYHSARQVIYGVLLALAAFLSMTGVLEAVETRLSQIAGYHSADECDTRGRAHSSVSLEVLHSPTNATATATANANPALGIAHLPLVSTLLHESFYADEVARRFYRFPFIALASFQLVAWVAMLFAPEARFSWRDVAAIIVGHVALAAIVQFKLRLPAKPSCV